MNHRVYLYLESWLQLFDGIIGILTFGFVKTKISFQLVMWYLKKGKKYVKQ
jgi:hypothetical protein